MDQLAVARRAIEEEIAGLSAEVQRLNGVLASLDRPGTTASAAKPAQPQATAISSAAETPKVLSDSATSDLDSVLSIIKDSGKKGIKALSLASILKKSGQTRPSKEELLQSGKVKVSGKGGGTTYSLLK